MPTVGEDRVGNRGSQTLKTNRRFGGAAARARRCGTPFLAVSVWCLSVAPAIGQPCYAPRSLQSLLTGGAAVSHADLDGDGDLDIASAWGVTDVVAWFENDGGVDPQFTKHEIANELRDTEAVLTVDLDDDGDIDIITHTTSANLPSENLVIWYENDGTPDPAFTRHVVASMQTYFASSVDVADVNGDGDLDLLATAIGEGEVTGENGTVEWYESDGAVPPSFTTHVLPFTTDGANAVAAADLDGDLDTDLIVGLSALAGAGEIIWYENNGADPPVFTQHLILAGRRVEDLHTDDVDGDGDIDVVAASQLDGVVMWYENNGAPIPTFAEVQIAALGAASVRTVDIDGDGDRDVLVGPDMRWYEHNGAPDPVFTERTITPFANGVSSADAADLDGDGDTDFVGASSNAELAIAWYEYTNVENLDTGARYDRLDEAIAAAAPGESLTADPQLLSLECQPVLDYDGKAIDIIGTGTFARGEGTETILADNASLSAVTGAEISLSGSVFIPPGATSTLSANRTELSGSLEIGAAGGLVAGPFLEIQAGVGFASGRQVISSQASYAFWVHGADIDADGDVDVVSASAFDGKVAWYENDGGVDPAFTEHVVTTQAAFATSVYSIDLDLDGDIDILSSSADDNTIAWYESDGAVDPIFTERIITTLAAGAASVHADDLDGDGDFDVLSATLGGDTVEWYENDGSPDPQFTRHIVSTQTDNARSVYSADVDGDGDVDILSASQVDGKVAWFENDGAPDPTFTERIIVEDSFSLVASVFAADLDDDGDLDVLTATQGTDTVAWHENDGAVDPSFTERILTSGADGATSVYAADMDGDGDLDVLSAARGANTISWFANDGAADPSFTRSIISFEPAGPWSVFAADVDGDGDLDVLSASSDDSTIGWHENTAVAGVELAAPGTSIRSTGGLALVNKSMRVGETSTIEAAASLTVDRSSSLAGAGTARASVLSVAGEVVPDPGALLTIDGDYEQFYDDGVTGLGTGELRIGLGDGSSPSALAVTGGVSLAGSLIVTADPGFDAPQGAVFTIVTAGVPIGVERFDLALLPGLPDGKFLRVAYDQPIEGPGAGSVSLIVETLGEDIGLEDPDDLAVAGLPVAAELADMNADGLPDVLLAIPDAVNPLTAPGSALVLLNGGTDNGGPWLGFTGGVAQAPVGADPSAIAAGQLDGQPGPDVAVSNRADDTASLLLNDGAGVLTGFADIAFNDNPAAVVIGDLDEDGFGDVAVAGDDLDSTGLLTVRLNAGEDAGEWAGLSATSSGFGIGAGPTFMDIGDLDNDSCLDIFVTSQGDGGVSLLDNLAGGQGGLWNGFDDSLNISTGSFPSAADIGDLDNDSCLDILITNRGDGSLSLILHSGGPGVFAFQPAANIPVGPAPRSVASADLDGDGDLDVALITDSDDGAGRVVRLLRNDFDPGSGQIAFAPASLVVTPGEPLFVLAGDVDAQNGPDLVAITEGIGELERGQPAGGVSVALNIASGCNAADLSEPFGLLDLQDINTFAAGFLGGDLVADLDGNGLLDLQDINQFVAAFLAGCP